jgi:hypothetical protein
VRKKSPELRPKCRDKRNMIMSKTLQPGDRVEWETSQGKTRGKVKEKITSGRSVKGHRVAATRSDPQFLVVSEKSGKPAAHKPRALRKVRG